MRTRTKVLKQSFGLLLSNALGEVQARVLSWAIGEPVWISSYGRVSTYSQLDDHHLRNILKMMRRDGSTDTPEYIALYEEFVRRGRRWR